MNATIFVQLRDEGTDVWRPVTAEYIRDTVYRIISEPPNADEVWAFKTGDIVRCRKMGFASGKTELVAFEILAD
jgi:hypothetical protein